MRRLRYASILVGLVAAIVPVLPAGAGPAVTTPNDPLFRNDQPGQPCFQVTACVDQQWNLMSDGRGTSADSAWELTKGRRVTIAVLDSGFDLGHGTGTAGVAGAQQNNGVGGSGVAPGARILPLRVSDTFIVAPTRLAQAI